ncbi:hypothetical protein E8E12_011612 [Didymella heteroderae]|uniref:FAD-binding PCMH-type domain-containing protein n=1 Tax=Didymella heteroderae TaxID=1769908 RepID=A0A9P4WZY7_9PLEO|nr:hypothetical protein E8E12_011612 [Didymella heteroderae]
MLSTTNFLLVSAFFLASPVLGELFCKTNPLDPSWPTTDEWNALNQSTNGVLIHSRPVASSCYDGNPFESTTSCAHVQENWFLSAFHAEQPESIGYSYWANNTCVPPNDYGYIEGQQCQLGGLPEYILNASTAEQVATAAEWASSRNIRIVVKGTGHDLNGRSSGAYSLSIWTRHLTNTEFDANWPLPGGNGTENVAIFGSGNTWGAALESAAAVGRTVVSGQDPTVGLGGFIGGGGHGPLSSHYGLAADQVLQATVVTTGGQILVANDAQNRDMFWAIRGGGPGLYGIVIEYVIRTHPLPQNVVLGTLRLSIDENATSGASDASWNALATLVSSLPDLMDSGITGNGIATTTKSAPNASSAAKGVTISLTLFGYNTTTAAFKSSVEPIKSRMLASAADQTVSIDLSETQVLPSYSALFDVLNPMDSSCGEIKDVRGHLQNITQTQVAGGQARLIIGLQGGLGPRNVEMRMRGALTPAWREAYLHVIATGTNVNTTDSTPKKALSAAAAWAEGHKEAVWRKWAPESGSYINEANPFNSNFKKDFYGGNYERLVSIKNKYDPTASLYVQSGVGSDVWSYDLDSGKLCREIK